MACSYTGLKHEARLHVGRVFAVEEVKFDLRILEFHSHDISHLASFIAIEKDAPAPKSRGAVATRADCVSKRPVMCRIRPIAGPLCQ
jgi:hypothetical protein